MEVQVAAAEPLAQQVRAGVKRVIELAPKLREILDRPGLDRRHVVNIGREPVRIVVSLESGLHRVRQVKQPLIVVPAAPLAGRGRQAGLRMAVGQIQHDRRRLVEDGAVVDQGRDAPVGVELEVVGRHRLEIDLNELVVRADLLQRRLRRHGGRDGRVV